MKLFVLLLPSVLLLNVFLPEYLQADILLLEVATPNQLFGQNFAPNEFSAENVGPTNDFGMRGKDGRIRMMKKFSYPVRRKFD